MNICVFGASSYLIDETYIVAGEELGRTMVERGHGLVFGGGAHGLMGAVVRGVTEMKGTSIGVVPTFFNVDGILFDACTETIRTDTMRQRKQIMDDRSDAFIMTPGGIGTFEEFFEILTLKQLGRHIKPIAVLNTNGYYDAMELMMDRCMNEQFMRPACRKLYGVFDEIGPLLDYIETDVQEKLDISIFKNV